MGVFFCLALHVFSHAVKASKRIFPQCVLCTCFFNHHCHWRTFVRNFSPLICAPCLRFIRFYKCSNCVYTCMANEMIYLDVECAREHTWKYVLCCCLLLMLPLLSLTVSLFVLTLLSSYIYISILLHKTFFYRFSSKPLRIWTHHPQQHHHFALARVQF